LLNKLLIPSVLTATILIAGIFALIPVQNATSVDEEILAAVQGFISNSENAVLIDLGNKTKLSSDSDTSGIVSDGGDAIIQIRALDGGQPTTFNLKECYLTGTTDNGGSDDVEVRQIEVDGERIFTDENGVFTPFGPWDDFTGSSGTATVEIISGLGFHTGLGADDTITLTVRVDSVDVLDEIFCIAFVQNRADLQVIVTQDPPD